MWRPTVIDKVVPSADAAVSGIASGSTVMIGGFGEVGVPMALIDALVTTDVGDLTVVANNAGVGERGIAALLRADRVRKIICSFPRSEGSVWFERRYGAGQIELQLVPQGTLSERIRAGGAGIGGFFTPTAAGTRLAVGREHRVIGGIDHVLEDPIRADVALIRADLGDRWGNLVYRGSARNFGPTMAMAATLTVAQVRQVVPLGELDGERIVTPGIFVDRLVEVGDDR